MLPFGDRQELVPAVLTFPGHSGELLQLGFVQGGMRASNSGLPSTFCHKIHPLLLKKRKDNRQRRDFAAEIGRGEGIFGVSGTARVPQVSLGAQMAQEAET